MYVNSSRTTRIRVGKSASVEKTATFSKETSKSSSNSQLQHQQHPDVNSTVKTPTLMGFRGNSRKTRQNGEKFVKKDTKSHKAEALHEGLRWISQLE
jgi:hypothetical protein